MDLLSLLMGSMTNESTLSALSGKTGASSQSITKLIASALPLLLRFLTINAGSQNGGRALLTALDGHTDTRPMELQIQDADEADGTKILNHIFGNDKDQVYNFLSHQSGMNNNQVNSVLSSIAPAILSGLSAATTSASHQVNLSDGLDLSDLMGMFGGSQPQQQSGGLLGSLFGGGQQPVQQQSSGGLLGSLFGIGQQPVQQQQQSSGGLLGSLFGIGQQPVQQQPQQSGGLLGSLFGGGQQQQQQPGNLIESLFTGGQQQPVQQSAFDGGDLLNLLASLMK